MLDPFLLAHHELDSAEPAQKKQRFLPDTFFRARRFAAFPVALPPSVLLLRTGHVQTHEKVIELHLATTNVPYMLQLSPIEHTLFEIILLHKLMVHFEQHLDSDRERRTSAVLGCMTQHRLTRLLLDVHHEEIEHIFQLGRASGMHQSFWESHFVGAASCARTICTFLELDDCRLFLPTIFEDCLLGVDLIVLNDVQDNWCVNVKTGRPDYPMHVEHVHTRPDDEDPAFQAASRRRIFDGTESMKERFDGMFRPCRIVVGKKNQRIYDLNVYEEDVDLFRRFVKTNRSQPFGVHKRPQNRDSNTEEEHAA